MGPGVAVSRHMKTELQTRTKAFALDVIRLVAELPNTKAADVIGYQVLKSGTSIGANYREANRAESREDFIHKIAICEKEAAETEYWLELLADAGFGPVDHLARLTAEVRELPAILVASSRTAKARR